MKRYRNLSGVWNFITKRKPDNADISFLIKFHKQFSSISHRSRISDDFRISKMGPEAELIATEGKYDVSIEWIEFSFLNRFAEVYILTHTVREVSTLFSFTIQLEVGYSFGR